MQSIKKIKNLKGKKVFLRADLNVPITNGRIDDAFRIKKVLPTIEYLKKKGAKIILASHLSKGEGGMAPVARALKKYIKVKFVDQVIGEKVTKTMAEMKNGDVVLLQDLRSEKGEQGRDKIFALTLSKYADFYVNEAFAVDHRDDASLTILPKLLPAYAGFQLESEIKNLSQAFKNPRKPFLFILGGAKFSTKAPLIEKYLKKADCVFVGGALLNDLLKAKGYEVGKSLVDDREYDFAKVLKNKKLISPIDVLVKNAGKFSTKKIETVGKDDTIIDIGKESTDLLMSYVKKSKFILWNGPLGKYEEGGDKATKEILKVIAQTKCTSIIGGGDTVALVSKLKMENKFTLVSTGGGATLDFLAKGTLPGIKALK